MRKSRCTEEQTIGILKQAEAGVAVAELCRQNAISDASDALQVAQQVQRIGCGGSSPPLEPGGGKPAPKRLVAELALDCRVLKEVAR
ncbi:MAG: transposase [Acidobacteriota bacterium]